METATQPLTERVSAYWQSRGKTIADKRVGRTFLRSDGVLACNECCFKDRECDTPGHVHRDSCPFCLGTGVNATPQETPAQRYLLPCPFCGATATRGMFNVWCDACQAQTVCDSGASTEQIIASWNTRYRDPAFQKLLKAAETLDRLDWVIGYEMKASEMQIVDEALDLAREALRLAREGEE